MILIKFSNRYINSDRIISLYIEKECEEYQVTLQSDRFTILESFLYKEEAEERLYDLILEINPDRPIPLSLEERMAIYKDTDSLMEDIED